MLRSVAVTEAGRAERSRNSWLRPEIVTPVKAEVLSANFTGRVPCFEASADAGDGFAFRLNANFGLGAAAVLSFSRGVSRSFSRCG